MIKVSARISKMVGIKMLRSFFMITCSATALMNIGFAKVHAVSFIVNEVLAGSEVARDVETLKRHGRMDSVIASINSQIDILEKDATKNRERKEFFLSRLGQLIASQAALPHFKRRLYVVLDHHNRSRVIGAFCATENSAHDIVELEVNGVIIDTENTVATNIREAVMHAHLRLQFGGLGKKQPVYTAAIKAERDRD